MQAVSYLSDKTGRSADKPAGPQNAQLFTEIDPGMLCGVMSQALRELAPSQRTVQLTGRFAADVLGRPASDLSRFVRSEVLGRGYGLRLLLSRSAYQEHDGARAVLTRLDSEGAHVRLSHSESLPHLAFVGSELALMHAWAETGEPQVLVLCREASDALHQFQVAFWDHAERFGPADHVDARSPQLDLVKTQVVRMLGLGMKDEAAARQMNVSVRTYRRYVASILEELAVNTRFEAGIKVAELGLLQTRQIPGQRTSGSTGRYISGFPSEDAC